MKRLVCLIILPFLLLCSCSKQSEAPKKNEVKKDSVKNVASNPAQQTAPAQLPAESYKGTSPEEIGGELMDKECFGVIKLGLSESELVKLIGEPEKKSKPEVWGADGMHHSTWDYKKAGLSIDMSGEKPKNMSVFRITLSEPCKFKSARNIGIGSTLEDVQKAYAVALKGVKVENNSLTAGTPFGGLVFTFENNKVKGIFLGAGAE